MTLRDVRYDPRRRVLALEIEPEGNARYTTQFIGTTTGYDPTRKPVRDAQGNRLPVTQRYSDDVGRVLATVEGTSARYELTGDELYVRAVVTSSPSPPRTPPSTTSAARPGPSPSAGNATSSPPPTRPRQDQDPSGGRKEIEPPIHRRDTETIESMRGPQ